MIVPMTRRVLVLALAFALGAGCVSTNVTTQGSTPYASPPTFEGDHPLVGRLVQSANLTDLTPRALVARAQDAQHVLLGEHHDNPQHHRGQAWILSQLGGTHPRVIFEMVDDDAMAARIEAGEDVSAAWAQAGWPLYDDYQQIFQVVVDQGLRVAAGLPSRARVVTVVKERLGSLSPEERRDLRLNEALDDALFSQLRDEMVAAHCGHAHPYIDGMVDAQRFKDAWMARVMRQAESRSVVIAGKGHTRQDRGIPSFSDGRVLSIHFVEVQPGRATLEDYRRELSQAQVVWFTAPVDRGDPCAMFKRKMPSDRRAK